MLRAIAQARALLLVVAGLATGPNVAFPASSSRLEHLTAAERASYLRRAKVWAPVDVARRDVCLGPPGPEAFAPGAEVTCTYQDRTQKPLGHTPKFDCRLPDGDVVKVKYGADNGDLNVPFTAS